MNINYRPGSCPRCGIRFQEYFDVKKQDFEEKYVAKLSKVRSNARYRGVVKGLIKVFVFLGIILLSLSWNEPNVVGYREHMQNFFSENPVFVFVVCMAVVSLLVILDGVGRVNLREEQHMWDQFLQEQSESDYLQPIL